MEPIRILLVGNGGREHALAWKLSQSPLVESIIAVSPHDVVLSLIDLQRQKASLLTFGSAGSGQWRHCYVPEGFE